MTAKLRERLAGLDHNPFLLPTPFVVSFSGGLTSALMLRLVLDAYGGRLPDDGKVVFNNTGKERVETLDFVETCSIRWGVPVVWLEYRYRPDRLEKKDSGHSFAVVDYEAASRKGEPFDAVIRHHADYRKLNGKDPVLPNPVQRFCTSELKIRTQMRYLRSLGWEEWSAAIGLRADEPRRVAKIKNRMASCVDPCTPLHKAGVTVEEVNEWWAEQPFKLALLPHEGNCDLCFLKKKSKLLEILSRRPDLAAWWAKKEEETKANFRRDRPLYPLLLREASEPNLFCDLDDGDMDCFCTD